MLTWLAAWLIVSAILLVLLFAAPSLCRKIIIVTSAAVFLAVGLIFVVASLLFMPLVAAHSFIARRS